MKTDEMYKHIESLINKEIASLERETRKNYLSIRKAVQAGASSMWDVSAVENIMSEQSGLTMYVSRAESNKYGRRKKFDDEVKGIVNRGRLKDISNVELAGMRIYELQYNGYAWAYSQGEGLPITGGVKLPLVAQAVFSDATGRTLQQTLAKNWAKYQDDILSAVTRELNQGSSYSKMANIIKDTTGSTYSRALTVARTEAGRIQSEAYVDNTKLLDDVGSKYRKMWVATIDGSTRDDHAFMDGEFADDDGLFQLPSGAVCDAPRRSGNPGDDINCRCSVITVFDETEKPTERRVRDEGIVPYQTFSERLGTTTLAELREARKNL